MADLTTLRMALEASRRFDVTVGAAVFHLAMPSEYDIRRAAEDNRDANGLIKDAQMMRVLMQTAVVGWEGVRTTDIAPGVDPEPIAFSDTARTLLLDQNMEVADAIALAMGAEMGKRRAQRQADEKNSSRAPNGT